MKTIIATLLLVAVSATAAPKKFLPHILPDAPSSEYQKYVSLRDATQTTNQDIQDAIQVGQRNLAWLTHMNSLRPDGQKIQLTKVGDLHGIPIESPKQYSPKTVGEDYNTTYQGMPADMAKVLYSNLPLTDNPPIPEADYIDWAKKIDRNYQTAVRWTLMEPYLNELEQGRSEDLRGFYFLSKKTPNVESTLRSFDTLPAEQQAQIKDWLTQMCQNRDGLDAKCDDKVATSIQNKQAYELYLAYLSTSQSLWDGYFSLENPRAEIVWSSKRPNVMDVPFTDPKNPTILNFLKVNIEDEWKWDLWNLQLNFVPQTPIHVVFQPGVTPHVNAAGGDTITMDANTPLTEWDVQWTIRHEFGHILGFVDCYEEFYDPTSQAIVSYQLDIDHLMCSRAGRMQKSMYDTLKKFYYK